MIGVSRRLLVRPKVCRWRCISSASRPGLLRQRQGLLFHNKQNWQSKTPFHIVAIAFGLGFAYSAQTYEVTKCEETPVKSLEKSFVYQELTEAIKSRKDSEKQLLELRAKARNRIFLLQERLRRGDYSEKEFRLEMHKLKQEVNNQAQQLLYGVSADTIHAREEYLKSFGCVKWTEEVMQTIVTHSPLIEIGAGNGQWAEELTTKYKADIVAYDNESELPVNIKDVEKKVVQLGDETKLSEPGNKDRTLLLVAPPPTDMATKCLARYKGKTLIFVGEGKDGAHATPDFFKELEKNWEIVQVLPVENFPECHERCFVLQRKQRSWFGFF